MRHAHTINLGQDIVGHVQMNIGVLRPTDGIQCITAVVQRDHRLARGVSLQTTHEIGGIHLSASLVPQEGKVPIEGLGV